MQPMWDRHRSRFEAVWELVRRVCAAPGRPTSRCGAFHGLPARRLTIQCVNCALCRPAPVPASWSLCGGI